MEDVATRVYDSALKFLQTLTTEETYKLLIEESLKLVNGREGSILLKNKTTMKRVYATNPLLYKIKPRPKGFTYNVYKTRKARILTAKQESRVHPEIGKTGIKYDIIVPLVYRSRSIGVFAIMTDKSLSKEEFEALKLFGPLGTLAIRKAELYEEIEKAIETRDLFISLASHELKTPITTIYIYLQLLQKNMDKNKPFDPNWITTLLYEMTRLTKLVDNLLEINQIRSGKINYEWEEADIREIVNRAITTFKANHKNRKVKLVKRISASSSFLIADFDKIIEVIVNLLDNGAKHSNFNTEILVTLGTSGNFITISIKDQGEGIKKEEIGRIFEGFYKAENNTKPGMGLGLYLTREIVKTHKGKIKVTSQFGKGTTFTVFLPILNKKLPK